MASHFNVVGVGRIRSLRRQYGYPTFMAFGYFAVPAKKQSNISTYLSNTPIIECQPKPILSKPMKPPNQEVTYYEANPSMFRNEPIGFVVTCLLCLVVVGIIMFIVWWLRCKGTTLTVTSDRTRLRKGILSKSITEVWHRDVRNVQLNQTFFQRLFGVGKLGISSSGQSGVEIMISGIPDPEHVKELIDKHRRIA